MALRRIKRTHWVHIDNRKKLEMETQNEKKEKRIASAPRT